MARIRVVLGVACGMQLTALAACSSSDASDRNDQSSRQEDAKGDEGDEGSESGSPESGADDSSSDDDSADDSSSGGDDTSSSMRGDDAGRAKGGDGRATYQRDIRPLLENNCVECHTAGGIGPAALDDWETVQSLGSSIVGAVMSGIMPPWPASDTCHPLQDARSLPQATKDLFAKWQSDGFLEGDTSDYVAPEKKRRLDLGPPALTMQGNESFTPAANGDSYRCFYAGTVAEDTYITALDIVPTDRAEVHHVQLHKVDPEDIETVKFEDESEDGGGYACNSAGVGGFVSSQNLFSYRPGAVAVVMNEGDAVYLKGGSGLVLQVHYNTQFLPAGKTPGPDQTGIQIWTMPKGKTPSHVIFRTGLLSPLNGSSNGNDGLVFNAMIPANQANVIGATTLPMSGVSVLGRGLTYGAVMGDFLPGEIVGMTPHAHAWATKMTASLRPTAGGEECLIDIPQWNYNWQLDYMFTTGVSYTADDVLHVQCEFDNTANHQPTINGTKRTSQTLTFGESTLNEMCEHYLWLRFKYEDFQAAL